MSASIALSRVVICLPVVPTRSACVGTAEQNPGRYALVAPMAAHAGDQFPLCAAPGVFFQGHIAQLLLTVRSPVDLVRHPGTPVFRPAGAAAAQPRVCPLRDPTARTALPRLECLRH